LVVGRLFALLLFNILVISLRNAGSSLFLVGGINGGGLLTDYQGYGFVYRKWQAILVCQKNRSTDLKVPKEGTHMNIIKGFSKMWFLVLLLVTFVAGVSCRIVLT
jgi:hypothetical protein